MTGYDDNKLHSFLFDELPSPEREEIEQRIFADDELFARVEEIETDLIDSYAADSLPSELKKRFETSLTVNPSRREKVVVARVLLAKMTPSSGADRSRVLPFSRRHARALQGALAAALLAAIVGTPLLLQRSDESTQPPASSSVADATPTTVPDTPRAAEGDTTATDSAATTETPLVAITRPPVPTVATEPSAALRPLTFVLSTIALRSGAGFSTLELDENIDVVDVQLMLESDEYSSYNVGIKRADGTSVWTGTRLPLTTIDAGPALSFAVPASAFANGRHELVLAGIAESHTQEVAYVDFDVVRR